MSKNKEQLCDKLVQQIACLVPSQWSNYPAECGHHIIGRGNLLWRWRLMNIAPLTIEEHAMTHAGLMNPLAQWQKDFAFVNRNRLLTHYLVTKGITRDDFVNERFEYLTNVKNALEKGLTTWDTIINNERRMFWDEND